MNFFAMNFFTFIQNSIEINYFVIQHHNHEIAGAVNTKRFK